MLNMILQDGSCMRERIYNYTCYMGSAALRIPSHIVNNIPDKRNHGFHEFPLNRSLGGDQALAWPCLRCI